MEGIMRICAGLVGPKSENVDFSSVFQAFLKGSRGGARDPGARTPEQSGAVGRG